MTSSQSQTGDAERYEQKGSLARGSTHNASTVKQRFRESTDAIGKKRLEIENRQNKQKSIKKKARVSPNV
jgi:hypothetical protein